MSTFSGKAIILSAPSGSGKTTVIQRLLQSGLDLEFSISACSRSKRPHEVDGRDYFFLTPEEFRQKIEAGDFLEWEEVYQGMFYGSLNSVVENIWKSGKHAAFDIDVKGALQIKSKLQQRALSIFIAPPSIDVLEQRLRIRNTETEESLKIRLDKAAWEMQFIDKFDICIVNDDLEKAVQETYTVVKNFLQ